jgi:hypothetical protein
MRAAMAATVLGSVWLAALGQLPPRYMCLKAIETNANDQKNKDFCAQAGDGQCFDVYRAGVSASKFMNVSGSCTCYCAEEGVPDAVISADKFASAKLPKRLLLSNTFSLDEVDFKPSNPLSKGHCILASDVRDYITSLQNPTAVRFQMAAMALPLVRSAGMQSFLLGARFLPNTESLENGLITEGEDILHLATGLQPAGSMSVFFTSATRPNTYVIKGDLASQPYTPLQPGATRYSAELNIGGPSGISSLKNCSALEGLTVDAIFTAPTALPGALLRANMFFDIDDDNCLTDPLRCQDASSVYKACKKCNDKSEVTGEPCTTYRDTKCTARPTMNARDVALMLSNTDATSLKKSETHRTLIYVLIGMAIAIVVALVFFVRKESVRRVMGTYARSSPSPRKQGQSTAETKMYGSNLYM